MTSSFAVATPPVPPMSYQPYQARFDEISSIQISLALFWSLPGGCLRCAQPMISIFGAIFNCRLPHPFTKYMQAQAKSYRQQLCLRCADKYSCLHSRRHGCRYTGAVRRPDMSRHLQLPAARWTARPKSWMTRCLRCQPPR